MKKSLADQVREYIEYRGAGYTPSKLAADVAKLQRDLPEADRCKRQNIEQLLEKGFRTVRYLPALAAAMGTSVEDLVSGAFIPGANAPFAGDNVALAPAAMRPRKYPVISSVQAGEWSEIVDNFQPGDADDWQDSPVDLGPHGFILQLEGDSMTNPVGGKDNFPDGMYVHVNPDVEAQPGDYVIAKREHENKATFKKLVRVDGEQYLHAINPTWPKPYIKLEPGDKIVGKLKFAGWSF